MVRSTTRSRRWCPPRRKRPRRGSTRCTFRRPAGTGRSTIVTSTHTIGTITTICIRTIICTSCSCTGREAMIPKAITSQSAPRCTCPVRSSGPGCTCPASATGCSAGSRSPICC
uniref:(northern house mosquito) hypothetical protein n=1 Tax=Culex pipiens TaxID=7175 RepID=A0A8D8BV30_CULPI